MSDRRANPSEIWDSWVLVIHKWRTVELVHDWGVIVRDRKKYKIFCVAIGATRCEIDM